MYYYGENLRLKSKRERERVSYTLIVYVQLYASTHVFVKIFIIHSYIYAGQHCTVLLLLAAYRPLHCIDDKSSSTADAQTTEEHCYAFGAVCFNSNLYRSRSRYIARCCL